MAALWILCALLVFTFRQGLGAAQITDPTEVEALKDIWRSLKDPYKNLSNWNSGDPCASNWTGVVCYNASQSDDSYLHVEELDLLNMNLSGILSPQLGRLSYLKILDFMWNSISGSIPKEIGNITTLELLLLNGNKLTGPLPDELGYLPNLDRIQIDQNQISGQLPKSFANLNKTRHFHMNNNSISGQIPVELSRLPKLVHFLLDNNNLSGHLPPEFSELPSLLILQVDNNNFSGTEIPPSYSNMSKLLKLSLRNCNLQGPIPDLSSIQDLGYLDLSSNLLNGSLQSKKFSSTITTIDLSNNNISGPIPEDTFSGLPYLQILSVANNELVGSISSMIWQNITLNGTERVILDFQNNKLSNISGSGSINNLPLNVSLRLQGNPICREEDTNIVQFCGIQNDDDNNDGLNMTNSISQCDSICPPSYESWSLPPMPCFCAAPLLIGYRLKSPGFTYFEPYRHTFEDYLSSGLSLYPYQLQINHVLWQKGPRLSMKLKIFPVNGSHEFNKSELFRIKSMFTGWNIKDSDLFGPYELLNFTLLDIYKDYVPPRSTGLSKGALAGIVLGTIAGAVTLSAIVALILFKMHLRNYHVISRRRPRSLISIKIDGVKRFTYSELVTATNNFNSSTQIGQGGYGNVYKGSLSDGTMVAIKRAQQGSLQGEREFLTEIEFLSRLHHRNLVSLIGYCDEESEQMLVYEFMPNGTIRDHLSGRSNKDKDLSFSMRLKIALGSAKGILYLHTEADPPIFHRDIKATNILLDSSFVAKVADFGLSRLAPVPDMDGSIPDHVSTVVKGTPGYLDPEYFLTHKLTDKSDVYSLGVVFMELFTGMQPISHGKNIVREVNAAYQSGTISSLIDSRMAGSYPSECVEKLLKLALRCCFNETDLRPPMSDVVRELDTIWLMASTSQSKIISEKEEIIEMIPSCSSSSYDMSSSTMTHTNVSSDVSGSDLVSGVHPTITPR